MGDAIRRVAALATVEKMYKICEGNLSDYHDLLVACFTDLPPAQQWIPTSERLPEGICQAIVQTNGGAIHEVFYKGKNDYGHEVWMRFDGGIYWDDEVVAWMPIPEPWKGERDG